MGTELGESMTYDPGEKAYNCNTYPELWGEVMWSDTGGGNLKTTSVAINRTKWDDLQRGREKQKDSRGLN